MKKSTKVVCTNIFKHENEEQRVQEFNKILARLISQEANRIHKPDNPDASHA